MSPSALTLSTSSPPSRGSLEHRLKRSILHRFTAQLEDFFIVVRLSGIIQRGFVATFKAAFLAAVQQNPAFFGAVLHTDGLEQTQAVAGAVSRKDVYVQTVQAVRTVVSDAALLERQNFAPTV